MNAKDVKRIRAKLDLSQSQFAELLGVSVRTLQDWEQGRNSPGSSAVALLKLADAGALKDDAMITEISAPRLERKIQRMIRDADRLQRVCDLMRRDDLEPEERKELTKLRQWLSRFHRTGL